MRRRSLGFFLSGLLVALLLAGVVSNFASGSPDGLDAAARKGCTVDAEGAVTGGTCMAQQEQDHQFADSPLADYSVRGISNGYLSTGLSGILGVLVTFGVGAGLLRLVRRRDTARAPSDATATPSDATGTPPTAP